MLLTSLVYEFPPGAKSSSASNNTKVPDDLALNYPSFLSGEYLGISAGKPKDNFDASPVEKRGDLWVSQPTGSLKPICDAPMPSYFLSTNT